MADINLGDVRASLRLDTGDFARSMQEALQRLEALSQQLRQMQQAQQQTGQSSAQIAQALRDLAQATQQGTQAYTQAAQQALAYRQEQDRLRESTRQTREEQGRATDGWRQFLQIAGGVGLATGLTALVSQMTAFAKSVVEVGVQMQALRTTLGAIAGDASAGARQFQFLFEVGQRLGVSVTALADGYRSLSAATRGTVLQGQETQKIFEGITIAGRAFGATSAQIGQGMLALEQMISKGTVSMEELRRQLGNAIPGAFELAAKAIGVTTAELTKLVESGELRSIPFVRSFARYLTEELSPAAAKAGETASAAFAQLGNELVRLKDNLAQSGLLEFLRTAAKDTADLLTRVNALIEKMRAGPPQLVTVEQNPAALNLSPEQSRELERLRTQQRQAERDIAAGGAMQPFREDRLAQLKAEEQQLLANAAAQQAQVAAQKALTDESRRTRNEREQEAATFEAMRVKLEEGRKALVQLGRQQQFVPELGTEAGTAEQLATFQAQQQEIREKTLQEVNRLREQLPRTAGAIPQDIQAGFNAIREGYSGTIAAIKAADEAEKARADAQRKAEQAQRQAEQQREQAIRQEISLTTELGRLHTYLGATGQSAAAQAQLQVAQQGLALQQSAQQALETIRRNPFIPRELAAQFEAGLAQLPAVVDAKAQEAFRKTDEQLQARTASLGDQISAVADRLSAAGLSPLDAKLAQISRTFAEMERQLLALQTTLTESREGATDAGKAVIDAQLARLQALRPLVDPARDAALQEARDRPQLDEIQRLRNQLVQLRAQRDERLGIRAEQRVAETMRDPARRAEADALVAQIKEQERLNHYMQLFESLGNSVGSAWTTALQGIAQGTQTVAAAFKAMAQSILQSMTQIASQEAFKGLIRVAAGVLFGGATAPSTGEQSVPLYPTPKLFGAEGAIVNRPTLTMLGENPATTPEVVMNRQQMQAFLRAGPSAGGQAAGGIAIINVPNLAMAQEEQAKQRAMGKEAIINIVLSEMAQGDRSQILKTVRLTGR
ncbi:MAG TPA: tape measure protein [Nitrospiraceae bacterium]